MVAMTKFNHAELIIYVHKIIKNISGQFDILRKPSNFIPYQIHHDRHLPWEPCTCKEYPGPLLNPQHPSSSSHEFKLTNKVDDKLERPFSKTT